MKPTTALFLAIPLATGVLAPAVQAQVYGPGWDRSGWNRPGWNGPGWPASRRSPTRSHDPREGQVDVTRFVIDGPAAQALGHGPVSVESESGPDGTSWLAPNLRSAYEAAVVDALVGAGYDTLHPGEADAQQVTLTIARRMLSPAEEKRSPVSGSAAMSVGTLGSAYGLAVNVDLSKPRAALVSTRMDMRILDKAGGNVLWEGHAEIATREDDDDWGEDRIARKLASALLDRFPEAQPVSVPPILTHSSRDTPADDLPPPSE